MKSSVMGDLGRSAVLVLGPRRTLLGLAMVSSSWIIGCQTTGVDEDNHSAREVEVNLEESHAAQGDAHAQGDTASAIAKMNATRRPLDLNDGESVELEIIQDDSEGSNQPGAYQDTAELSDSLDDVEIEESIELPKTDVSDPESGSDLEGDF